MVSLEEQETIIQFNRTDKQAIIYTSDSTMMTKLDRMCANAPGNYSLKSESMDKDGKIVGKTYILADKKLFSFRAKKKEMNFTEEDKRKFVERMNARNQNLVE